MDFYQLIVIESIVLRETRNKLTCLKQQDIPRKPQRLVPRRTRVAPSRVVRGQLAPPLALGLPPPRPADPAQMPPRVGTDSLRSSALQVTFT